MKIEFWSDPMRPPEGFVLGPPPQDFGCGRGAYCGDLMMNRGEAVITHRDGTKEILGVFKKWDSSKVLAVLKEAAADGLEIVGA
jgi:hypothetical protein